MLGRPSPGSRVPIARPAGVPRGRFCAVHPRFSCQFPHPALPCLPGATARRRLPGDPGPQPGTGGNLGAGGPGEFQPAAGGSRPSARQRNNPAVPGFRQVGWQLFVVPSAGRSWGPPGGESLTKIPPNPLPCLRGRSPCKGAASPSACHGGKALEGFTMMFLSFPGTLKSHSNFFYCIH